MMKRTIAVMILVTAIALTGIGLAAVYTGTTHTSSPVNYDGITVAPMGLENVSKLPVLWEEMKRRGYSQNDIEKVAGKNFLRVLEAVEKLALGA